MNTTHEPERETNDSEDEEEKRLQYSVLDSFRRIAHLNATHVRRQNLFALPSRHWNLLSKPPFSILETLDRVDSAIDANADLADAIVAAGTEFLGVNDSEGSTDEVKPEWHGSARNLDLDKAVSSLHQLYRDWSKEGRRERSASYEPILNDLKKHFPMEMKDGNGFRVLVPGAGLGRLLFEIARLGYTAEGNEISYHQLLISSFILNCTQNVDEWRLYPFATTFSNNLTRQDQLREFRIPSVHPGSMKMSGKMSMSAGDFCVLYKDPTFKGAFDAVASTFFIDTGPNLIKYIETVWHCLTPGGLWMNIGPLHWHYPEKDSKKESEHKRQSDKLNCSNEGEYEDKGIGEAGSFELSQDEVVDLVKHFGFKFLENETYQLETGYIQNPRSMLQHIYKPMHWIARKPSN